MLRSAGAVVDETGPDAWRVEPGPLAFGCFDVEPDLSSAAPFLAAAVATGGTVRVTGWPTASHQPGALLPPLLAAFGATCEADGDALAVTGPARIRGVDLDLADAGELTPVLTALAALADSPSRFRGVGYLRGHETDRLAALARELSGLGGDVTEEADGLSVRPAALHGGRFRTYDDHRLAMAAAVLGLAVDGVLVENVATTAKTFPGFAALWEAMLS
jgi:3-phosphoshikimate 1-carboxyvinyltransferase